MAFIEEDDLQPLLKQSRQESDIWRKDYHEFERLADNEIIDDLDESLPEVNDGSLAAALFKLPKRIVNSDLKGRAKAKDRDEGWVTELANIVWESEIIPNANSQAPFHRKWKDAVRKAAIYGSVPLISLFVENGEYTGADFIVAQPQDVLLEPGKVSDYDSDVVFWDVYYTKLQVERLIERAETETQEAKEHPEDGYNKWNIPALKDILEGKFDDEERDSLNDTKKASEEAVQKKGYKFCIAFQRGVEAPFYMYHPATKKTVREWSNPDPSGDIPIHFLYCYQDFVNPYGTGIVKLAGGTQNVLDLMRQNDVLATILGFRPPVSIQGNTDNLDEESIVYAQEAKWYTGDAIVKREEISNQVYAQIPARIQMYKSSLNNLIPMGDTSVSSESGDPLQSKTPAGVKLAAANLSIDDEDFKDNLYMTYEAVARSMINIHFANMQGTDLTKLSDEDRDILAQAGLEFPVDEEGNPTNELEILWDQARAVFRFEIDPEQDKAKDEEKRLEGLMRVAELRMSDPTFDQRLMMAGKKLNDGELYSDIISLTSDNDKILEDVTPEDEQVMEEEAAAQMEQQAMAPMDGQPNPNTEELMIVMQEYGVDEPTGLAILEAIKQGYSREEIESVFVQREMANVEG